MDTITTNRQSIKNTLSHGVHHITFTKKDGTEVTYKGTRDWDLLANLGDAVGYKQPLGTANEAREEQDARNGLVTFYKLADEPKDSGFRRFSVDRLVSID